MPPTLKTFSISDQIKHLQNLVEKLKEISLVQDKLDLLNTLPDVTNSLKIMTSTKAWIDTLKVQSQYAVISTFVIGQGTILFRSLENSNASRDDKVLNELNDNLLEIDKFYDSIGGIIGYHVTILKLMTEHLDLTKEKADYQEPFGIDLSKDIDQGNEIVRFGIEALSSIAEIYPVGGAGDRLSLCDEMTGEPLPAAKLKFLGFTLLEGLIRDLQGKEFLYYKLFGKQLMTPIALMTSKEKNNHSRMNELCEKLSWFGRGKASFRLFMQPLVPMVTIDGNWVLKEPLKLLLKPSGHGAIWKTAQDSGIFSWLAKEKRLKFIIRQINNPIASVDNGLLALAGMGVHYGKEFGFSSCRRLLNTPEGMNVIKKTVNQNGYSYCITNVEYTEFKNCGIDDVPEKSGSLYSKFPSNTNILFGDLKTIENTIQEHPLPGILLNMKNKVVCQSDDIQIEKLAGRLETTMQNIADFIVDKSPTELKRKDLLDLRTFLIYNDRVKTISVIKQKHESGKPIIGTPEGCLYDTLSNYKDLLENYCDIKMPELLDQDAFLSSPLNFMIRLHPSLGGLYSVISQKIKKGQLSKGSELIMEIAEAEIVDIDLEGSLIIEADSIMGKKDRDGVIIYNSENAGKCSLINVRVKNLGALNLTPAEVWQNRIERKESLTITLQGSGEFYAENVDLIGNLHFIVPDKHRLVVYNQNDEVAWHLEEISKATWQWEYFFNESNTLCLEKNINNLL